MNHELTCFIDQLLILRIPSNNTHIEVFDLATQFAEWLVSARGQSVIRNYRLRGKQLFYPDTIP